MNSSHRCMREWGNEGMREGNEMVHDDLWWSMQWHPYEFDSELRNSIKHLWVQVSLTGTMHWSSMISMRQISTHQIIGKLPLLRALERGRKREVQSFKCNANNLWVNLLKISCFLVAMLAQAWSFHSWHNPLCSLYHNKVWESVCVRRRERERGREGEKGEKR